MRVYLDHNAATPPFPEVWQRLTSLVPELLGNPSSVHQEGQRGRRLLEEARLQVAKLVGVSPSEVVFTSGGTEANAMALWGLVRNLGGPAGVNLYLGATEHPSVFACARMLAQLGAQVHVLPVDDQGLLLQDALAQVEAPAVVAVQLANHETGVLQPISQIVKLAAHPQVRFHCDAVQAVGKVPVAFSALGVDSLSLSGHKLGGIAGAGSLVVKGGEALPALIPGEQERRGRGGTQSLLAICAMGWACEQLAQNLDRWETVARLRNELERLLLAQGLAERIFGTAAPRIPNTTCMALPPPHKGSLAVIALDFKGVAVSSGPACSSGASQESAVVAAMGFAQLAAATIRVSLGLNSTAEEVQIFLSALKDVVSGRISKP